MAWMKLRRWPGGFASKAKAHFEFCPIFHRTDQPQIAAVETRQLPREVQAETMAGNVLLHRAAVEAFEDVFAPGLGWSGRCCRP